MDKKMQPLKGQIHKEKLIPVDPSVAELKGPGPADYGQRTGNLKQTEVRVGLLCKVKEKPLYWGPSSKGCLSGAPGRAATLAT